MYSKIFNYIQKKALFDKDKKVLVAVSGGVDSMNLLHFLHTYQDALAIEIGIVHVNHKQRLQSEEEEKFLKKWAKENNVPIYIGYFSGNFSEKKARDFRYHFFKEIMDEQGYTVLTTAHHANDQAETVLMRLIRGSLLRHLSAIKEVQPFGKGKLIRPFLHFEKTDLPNPFHFEDQSNSDNTYFRNRVRNHYLPEFSRENPRINQALRKLAFETQLLFEAFADLTKDFEITKIALFRNQTEAVQHFLLQDYLSHFEDLQLTAKQFQELLYIIKHKSSGSYPIKNSYCLYIDKESFDIKKIIPKTENNADSILVEYDSAAIYGDYKFSFGQDKFVNSLYLSVSLSSKSPITLRRRQSGDKINFGTFSKKLRRLFIDEKFTHQEREEAIVALQENQIIFVIVAGKTYLRKASNHDIMRATLCIENLEKR
nr:tRNA lysidine(34) synthetase TilS [Streptococcus catagoni]